MQPQANRISIDTTNATVTPALRVDPREVLDRYIVQAFEKKPNTAVVVSQAVDYPLYSIVQFRDDFGGGTATLADALMGPASRLFNNPYCFEVAKKPNAQGKLAVIGEIGLSQSISVEKAVEHIRAWDKETVDAIEAAIRAEHAARAR